MYQLRFWKLNFFRLMRFKIVFLVVKISGHQNIYFFNKKFKFLVKSFHIQFLKQSMTSEALHKKNKNDVIPSIFMKFWSRKSLDQLYWLTPKDVYFIVYWALMIHVYFTVFYNFSCILKCNYDSLCNFH